MIHTRHREVTFVFPDEVWRNVIAFLPKKECHHVAQTCHLFSFISKSLYPPTDYTKFLCNKVIIMKDIVPGSVFEMDRVQIDSLAIPNDSDIVIGCLKMPSCMLVVLIRNPCQFKRIIPLTNGGAVYVKPFTYNKVICYTYGDCCFRIINYKY